MKTIWQMFTRTFVLAVVLNACDRAEEEPKDVPSSTNPEQAAIKAPVTKSNDKQPATLPEENSPPSKLFAPDIDPTDIEPVSAVPEFPTEIEDQIDAMLAGKETLRDAMTDPEIQQLIQSKMRDIKPDPAFQERMKAASEIMIAAKMPDLKPGEAAKGRIHMEPTDMGIARIAIGYSLMDDPDGMIESFINYVESAAIQTAIDPDADNGFEIRERQRPPATAAPPSNSRQN
ncbi:MAG: hypothetical protein HKN23_16580 [Verrucomicrobiales bacterium]|nr:hypothetical protein [Verrucomicrobiales bacterium]